MLDFVVEHQPSPIPVSRRFTKAQLGACALTCRYWAERCRRRVFESLTLNSQKALSDLVEFISVNWSFAELVTRLVIEQDDGCVPWTHNVPRLLAHRLPNLRHLGYTNPPFFHVEAFSMHPHIARILPVYMSSSGWHITIFELNNQRYTSFLDLVRVVGSLVELRILRCTAVSWKNPLPNIPDGAHGKAGPYLRFVEVRGSAVYWPFIWFMTSTAREAPKYMHYAVDSGVVPILTRLESSLMNNVVQTWLCGFNNTIGTVFSYKCSSIQECKPGTTDEIFYASV